MKLQIKTLTGPILFESEAESIRELLAAAVKSKADLRWANLNGANLSGCDLSRSNLSLCNLRGCDLSRSNLSLCNLRGCDLSRSNLSLCNLNGADLSGCDLSGSNLSGAKGLKTFDALEWFLKSFKRTLKGVIVYKCFNGTYPPNPDWKIESGSTIAENCNFNPLDDCGCGVNFATEEWVRREYPGKTIWRCLIPWAWLPGVVIPWNSDGKARCSKLLLLRQVRETERAA